MTTFTDLGLNDELLQALDALGFKEPTPVQVKVIPPVALNGPRLLPSR